MQVITDHRQRLSQRLVQVGLVIALSLAIRVILFLNFPIALTADSWDYLSAAESVYQHADFNSYALRDIRLPGYPAFLAVIHPLTDMRSDRIILFQDIIGLFSVALGMLIGYQLGSPFVAIALGLFLGINPVYLLNEHAVMTEVLSLCSLLLFTVICISCFSHLLSWYRGAALGLTMAICLLVRANTLPFCGIMIFGAIFYRVIDGRSRRLIYSKRSVGIFVLAAILGAGLLIGPWLWRNYKLYHNLSIVNYNNRNLLIQLMLHGSIDATLPQLQQAGKELGYTTLDYEWFLKLAHNYPTMQAEAIAGAIYWEQVNTHPDLYARDVADTAAAFGGFVSYIGNDRTAMLTWFSSVVDNPQEWDQINNPSYAKERAPDFIYQQVSGQTWLGALWSISGQAYLRLIRPVLYVLFFGFIFAYIIKGRIDTLKIANVTPRLIVLVAASYSFIILTHSITLLDSDRYSSLFDWMPLLIILLITWQRFKAASPMELHGTSALGVGSNAGYTSRFN